MSARRTSRLLLAALLGPLAACAVATREPAMITPLPPSTEARTQAARALFLEAVDHARAERWAEARDRYALSLRFRWAPETLYSLGVAEQRTGRLTRAIANFRAFLREPASAASRPFERHARRALEDLEKRVSRLDVAILPADAPNPTVLLDARPLPLEISSERLVDPGVHVIEAHADGFDAVVTHVELDEGERRTIYLVLPRQALPAGRQTSAGMR
jgi:hypothetical protein